MEAVYVRCANGTAVNDMHYSGPPEDVYFRSGQKTYEYVTSERNIDYINTVNDYTYTYRFGPESFRTYDVQVLDITSHELLASCERRIDYGDDMKVDLSIITNEVNEEIYLSNGEFASGLPEEKYIDMPYNPKWDWRQEEEDGYYKITDKGYDQRRFTFAMYDMYNKFNFYTWFLEELDITVCATLGFTMHEGEDGYQYVQCVLDLLDENGNPYGGVGIYTIKNEKRKEKSEDVAYDLSGRKVNFQFSILNSQLKRKGIYIVKGKKIIANGF